MELTRQDQFHTGPSADDEKKKDTAEARLQRLLSRTLPSTQSVTILCHVVRIKKRCIFAGRSDGVVVFWKPASSRHTEGFDLKESHLLGHKGGVMCISFAPHFANNGLLFTGSIDRTIRAWDPWASSKSSEVIQVLSGHGSTVTSIDHADGMLFTCSNDQTLRIWRPVPGRDLLLFPYFETVQTIKMGGGVCMTSVALKSGENLSAYIVDSEGGLSFYNQAEYSRTKRSTDIFAVDASRNRQIVHRLGVTHVLIVQSQNFVITLSYDDSMRVFDAMTGSPFLSVDNPHRCRYTGLDWNEKEQELFIVDASGYLHVWNIYMEKCLKQQKIFDGPLTSVSVIGKTDSVFVTGNNRLERWQISREMKFEEFKGHVGPIIAIRSVNLKRKSKATSATLGGGKVSDGNDEQDPNLRGTAKKQSDSRIYSSAIDNTIRCWDPYDMTCMFTMTEMKSEISCMIYLYDSDVIVTGNEDGSVRWWNPSSGSTVALKEHTNTVSCMLFAPLRRIDYLITAGYDGKVGIWDVTKRRSVKPRLENIFQAHHGKEYTTGVMAGNVLDAEILCLAYNDSAEDPTKRTFFTAGSDGIIRAWNVISQSLESELPGHLDAITCMTMDANFLFSGSDDRSIRMWNVAKVTDAYELAVFEEAHSRPVRDLLILEDTGYLASCSFDGLLKVWNYGFDEATGETGKVVQEFEHPDQFRCLEYEKLTAHIFAGTEQGGVLSFTIDRSLLPEDHRLHVPTVQTKLQSDLVELRLSKGDPLVELENAPSNSMPGSDEEMEGEKLGGHRREGKVSFNV